MSVCGFFILCTLGSDGLSEERLGKFSPRPISECQLAARQASLIISLYWAEISFLKQRGRNTEVEGGGGRDLRKGEERRERRGRERERER